MDGTTQAELANTLAIKLLWIGWFVIDAVVVALWCKEPLFYTWHFPTVLVLGIALGASHSNIWRKR